MSQLEQSLRLYLKRNKLPGKRAQNIMAPSSRNPNNLNHELPPLPSAVLILIYPKDEKWHLALIKRNTYNGDHSGQISLPGGKLENTDKSLQQCALRETHEEIGVTCPKHHVLGELTPLVIPISNFKVTPYIAILNTTPHFKIDTHEVRYLIELPLDVIMKKSYKKERKISSQGQEISTLVYQLKDDYIWGATAMILSEFSEILSDCKYSEI